MRFPEFTGEWKRYRVSDFLEFYSTNSLSWEQLDYDAGEIRNIHYGLIHKGLPAIVNIDECRLPFIKESNTPKSHTLCKDGDIAFADASEDTNDVAKAVELVNCDGKKIICGLHTIHGRDRLNITYIGYKAFAFSSPKFGVQINKIAQGTKVFSISAKNFNELFIGIPSLDEQKKIVSLLSLIEERIATQNKIIEEYKKLKDTLVEKMFAYTNKKPELRFAKYDYDWFKHTYADIFKIATNRNADNNTLKVLSASQQDGMIERDQIDVDIKYNKDNIKSYKIVEVGDYIVHLRSFQGGFAYANINGICSPAYTILRSRNNTLSHSFLRNFFISKKFINTLRLVTYGIRDGKSINVEEFLNLEVSIPNSAEQNRIVDAITSMESKLKFEIELLILSNRQKQYLLTKMFI